MSSPLLPCSPIGPHLIQRNDASRTLIVNNLVAQFTPTEYRLLLALLQTQPLSDKDLAQIAFSREIDSLVRESLNKHMDKIRGKLQPLGLSVYRLRGYGYLISVSPDCTVAADESHRQIVPEVEQLKQHDQKE